MLFRKTKRGPVSDNDGATGAQRLVGARPVEHGCGSYFGSVEQKSNRSIGANGGLPPLVCLPLWGREEVTLAIFMPTQKNKRGFLQSQKIKSGF